METHTLLAEIEDYCAQTGFKPSYVCQRAVKNSHLYGRLLSGRDCTTTTARRVRDWMRENIKQKGTKNV